VLKTFALTDVLQAALAPVSGDVRAAFVYGSIAKGPSEELATRMKQDNAFVTRVLNQPKLWLIGGDSRTPWVSGPQCGESSTVATPFATVESTRAR
jgi:hypothetical protein